MLYPPCVNSTELAMNTVLTKLSWVFILGHGDQGRNPLRIDSQNLLLWIPDVQISYSLSLSQASGNHQILGVSSCDFRPFYDQTQLVHSIFSYRFTHFGTPEQFIYKISLPREGAVAGGGGGGGIN